MIGIPLFYDHKNITLLTTPCVTDSNNNDITEVSLSSNDEDNQEVIIKLLLANHLL